MWGEINIEMMKYLNTLSRSDYSDIDMILTLRTDSGPAEGDSPSGWSSDQSDTGGAGREMEGGLPQPG